MAGKIRLLCLMTTSWELFCFMERGVLVKMLAAGSDFWEGIAPSHSRFMLASFAYGVQLGVSKALLY